MIKNMTQDLTLDEMDVVSGGCVNVEVQTLDAEGRVIGTSQQSVGCKSGVSGGGGFGFGGSGPVGNGGFGSPGFNGGGGVMNVSFEPEPEPEEEAVPPAPPPLVATIGDVAADVGQFMSDRFAEQIEALGRAGGSLIEGLGNAGAAIIDAENDPDELQLMLDQCGDRPFSYDGENFECQ